METTIYERYGRKQEQLEQALEAAQKATYDLVQTLELLRRLKAGDMSFDQVEITETGWSVREPGPIPIRPARDA
jgi:hypothetical protein